MWLMHVSKVEFFPFFNLGTVWFLLLSLSLSLSFCTCICSSCSAISSIFKHIVFSHRYAVQFNFQLTTAKILEKPILNSKCTQTERTDWASRKSQYTLTQWNLQIHFILSSIFLLFNALEPLNLLTSSKRTQIYYRRIVSWCGRFYVICCSHQWIDVRISLRNAL